jgi:mono/diheme cytochrome c family protein
MTPISRRRLQTAALACVTSALLASEVRGQSGAETYQSACAACHGSDGKGAPARTVGFDTPLPDFTDCSFSTGEPETDWQSTVHLGGRGRGLSPNMPAFGQALSEVQIERVIAYVRGFCASTAWPAGKLNLPRALVTEKAFPDNEAFVTTAVPTRLTDRVETRFVYERRLGARLQYDFVVPFNVVQFPGGWNRGLGDIEIGAKRVLFDSPSRGSIASAGVGLTFPTGKETEGLGNRLMIVEPFGTWTQMLPYQLFVHAQAGMGFPVNVAGALTDVFWRAAAGRTFVQPQWGRTWSPIVEVLGQRELEFGERVRLDVVPELQVTLNRRQHIMASGGVVIPVTLRTRSPVVMVALLWEWAQGGLLSGW